MTDQVSVEEAQQFVMCVEEIKGNKKRNLKNLIKANPRLLLMMDENDLSLLHKAVMTRKIDSLNELLDAKGYDINIAGPNGNTPLHWAATYVNQSAILLLLTCPDIDVNAQNNSRQTPLHIAVLKGNLACVRALLIHKDIDVTIKNGLNQTPLEFAQTNVIADQEDIIDALMKHAAEYPPRRAHASQSTVAH